MLLRRFSVLTSNFLTSFLTTVGNTFFLTFSDCETYPNILSGELAFIRVHHIPARAGPWSWFVAPLISLQASRVSSFLLLADLSAIATSNFSEFPSWSFEKVTCLNNFFFFLSFASLEHSALSFNFLFLCVLSNFSWVSVTCSSARFTCVK